MPDARIDHGSVPITVGGRVLADRLLAARPELTARIVAHLVGEVPFYAVLPREQIDGDITRVVRQNLTLFGETLRTRRPPRAARMRELVESAALRAEEGVPLESVLEAYHGGMRLAWEWMTGDVAPHEAGDVVLAATLLLEHLRVLTAAVTGGYVQERLHMVGQEQAAQRSAVAALLDGRPLDGAGAPVGVRLAERYVVVRLSVLRHPDERGDPEGSRIAARRKSRRLTTAVAAWAPGEVLSVVDALGGVLLLPVPAGLPAADLDRRVDELVRDAARFAGAQVRAAAAVCERQAIPDAYAETGDVLDVVLAQGDPPGTHRLDDVLLEVQLSRPGPARERLARLLDPLLAAPELLRTLTVHLHHDRNRRRTATALHVHPNTVDYRIRRVVALTGLDPGRPDDLVRLTAALIGMRATAPGDAEADD